MAYDDEQGFQVLRVPVAEYLCRRWNQKNPPDKKVAEFEFVFCAENKNEAALIPGLQFARDQLIHLDFN